jgi:hypothetical protein
VSANTHAAAVAFILPTVAWPPIQAIRWQEQRKKVTMDVEFSGAYNERPAEALFAQRCLMVSFEDRELLDNDSYARIKALGRTYRGRQAWPEFRDYIPGSLPRRLEPPQVRFLTVAIQQTCDVALGFRDDAQCLLGPDEGQMLLREYVGGEWKERWYRPELATPVASEPPPPVDELRRARLASRRLQRLGV